MAGDLRTVGSIQWRQSRSRARTVGVRRPDVRSASCSRHRRDGGACRALPIGRRCDRTSRHARRCRLSIVVERPHPHRGSRPCGGPAAAIGGGYRSAVVGSVGACGPDGGGGGGNRLGVAALVDVRNGSCPHGGRLLGRGLAVLPRFFVRGPSRGEFCRSFPDRDRSSRQPRNVRHRRVCLHRLGCCSGLSVTRWWTECGAHRR